MSTYIKYPRTYHVPWSQGISSDDKIIKSMDSFVGKRVIVTEKMDGENTTMYVDHMHARSIDSNNHLSRSMVKSFHATIKHGIPNGWRICGENLYARHSIAYDNLKSYFYGFSIWNSENVCLSWDDTMEWFELLGIVPVTVIYDGVYDKETIKSLYTDGDENIKEGYVIRLADSFSYENFNVSVAKFVRKGHVQSSEHWMFSEIVPNKINLTNQ
jgi:hypothetical protein